MSKITQAKKRIRRHNYIEDALKRGEVIEVQFVGHDSEGEEKAVTTYFRSRRRAKVALYWAREHDRQELIDDLGLTYRKLALYRGILKEEEEA